MSVRACALSASLALLLAAGSAYSATIDGWIYTADHPDSVAKGAPDTLIYRTPDGELRRIAAVTDGQGHFRFRDLPADSSIGYVLKISFRGQEFLGAPVHFEAGQEELQFNVLLSAQPPPADELPPRHPPIPVRAPLGGLPRQEPIHAVVIVLCVVLLFAALALLARRERGTRGDLDLPPAARALVRDIAGLDLRHAGGSIAEKEYVQMRAGLLERLRSMIRLPGTLKVPSEPRR